MAKEKETKARIQNLTDSTNNWTTAGNAASPFIPKKGELIVYQDFETVDGKTTMVSQRYKFGNGINTINDLPWASEPYAVSYLAQTLTEAQQLQARNNINVLSPTEIEQKIQDRTIKLISVANESATTIDLSSNEEIHLQNTISSLEINSFISSFDGYSESWTILFTTSDTEPTLIIPNTVKWAVAEPVFDSNKTYMLSFVPFGDNYLGIWTVMA